MPWKSELEANGIVNREIEGSLFCLRREGRGLAVYFCTFKFPQQRTKLGI